MNILFIGHETELNGASRSMIGMISQWEREHNIYVLIPSADNEVETELRKHNITVICKKYYHCCSKKRKGLLWIVQCMYWKLYKRIRNEIVAAQMSDWALKNKIEVIHSNTSVIDIGPRIQRRTNIKHVWHIREFGDLDFGLRPYIAYQKYYDFMNQYTDRFICITKAVSHHFAQLDEDKKIVIYNGVESYTLVRNSPEDDMVHFLISGVIRESKGQRYAIQAVELLIHKGISGFKLYMAGDGILQEPISPACEGYVEVLGKVEDMLSLRKRVDVELVCSRAEAFGRVTAEAMMAGIPVIGSNSGGTPELIKDGETGILYQTGNVDDLAQKMEYMILHPEQRKMMGDKAMIYAKNNFTIERCAKEVFTVYENLLQGI